MRLRASLLVVTALAAAACFRGKLPPLELYRLQSAAGGDSAVPRPDGDAALAGSLVVAPYEARGVYDGRQIVYRVEGRGYGTYSNREWAVPLREELGLLSEEVLRAARLVSGPVIFDPPSRRRHTYLWRGAIREFEEVDRGDSVLVAVSIDAQLVRVADDSVLWAGVRRIERPAMKDNMPGIVATLADVSRQAVRELVDEARKAVASASATTAPQPSLR